MIGLLLFLYTSFGCFCVAPFRLFVFVQPLRLLILFDTTCTLDRYTHASPPLFTASKDTLSCSLRNAMPLFVLHDV
jgi:hypothetical protein